MKYLIKKTSEIGEDTLVLLVTDAVLPTVKEYAEVCMGGYEVVISSKDFAVVKNDVKRIEVKSDQMLKEMSISTKK